jgi:hypothetical protein
MGMILYIFHNLEKHVLRLRGEPFMLDCNLAEAIEVAFYSQWNMVTTNSLYVGAFLNPYLLHNKEMADDRNSLIVCKRVLQKLCPPKPYLDVVQVFLAFRHKQEPFHNVLDSNNQKCSLHDWWAFEGTCRKFVAPIARRLLRQMMSSSSCKRNWSSYSFVYNKSWNRLQPKSSIKIIRWELNYNIYEVIFGENISEHFRHRVMVVWSTLYPSKPFVL